MRAEQLARRESAMTSAVSSCGTLRNKSRSAYLTAYACAI